MAEANAQRDAFAEVECPYCRQSHRNERLTVSYDELIKAAGLLGELADAVEAMDKELADWRRAGASIVESFADLKTALGK
jgi:hypothetical protein